MKYMRSLIIVSCAVVLTVAGVMTATLTASAAPPAQAAPAAHAAPAALAAPAADALLSLNKPATASSSGGCCGAANVDDGVSTTRWASASGADPQWIYLDLGATAHVSRVRLQWDTSCATAYEIDTSADHSSWTKIYSTTAGKGGVEDLTSLDGTGRYVRMYGTKRCRSDASHGYSLQELGVYGTTGSDTTPPSPPGTPTLVSDTSNSVTIAWTASTDNVGVAGYDIYHDGQLCAQVGGSTLTGTCSSLNPNVAYGFYVNARDAAGNVSQPSGTLHVTTPPSSDTTPPTVPGNVHSTAVTDSSVTLAWTASTDNVAVAGYRVYNVVNGTRTQVGTADAGATGTAGRRAHARARPTTSRSPPTTATPTRARAAPRSWTSPPRRRAAARPHRASAPSPRSAPTTTWCGAWSRCRTARSCSTSATRTTSCT